MPTNENRLNFTLNPLLWLAASFAFGIAAAALFIVDNIFLLAAIFIGVVIALVFSEKTWSAFVVLFSFFFLGAFCYQVEVSKIASGGLKAMYDDGRLTSGDPVEIEGTIVGMPEPAPDGYFVLLDAKKLFIQNSESEVLGRLRLFAPLGSDEAKSEYKELELSHGTKIRVACRPERDERFLNPGVVSRKQLLDRKGIDATATVKSPLLIEKLGRDATFLPLAFVYEHRSRVIFAIREHFSASTAGVLIASMLGDKYFLDKQTADVFREGGTFHVLVISGLHITFIGGLILLIARTFTRNRKLQAFATVGLLWLYGIAVGGEAPVTRACVMFTILMFGYAYYRTSTLLNALGGSALVLLVWRPNDLFDPSFQLTFASVAAIFAFGLPLLGKLRAIGEWTPTTEQPFPPNVPNWLRRTCETIYWREAAWNIEHGRQIWSAQIFKSPFLKRIDDFGLRRILIFIFDGLVISLAVQIWLLPLTVYYYHRISLISIALNLWVGPLLAVESISAIIAVVLGSFSHTIAFPFVTLTEILNWLLVSVPSIFTDTTLTNFRAPVYSGSMKAIYFVYFLPVIIVSILVIRWDPFSLREASKKYVAMSVITAAFLMLIGTVIIFHPFSAPRPDGKLHVEFLDVGQGDSAFITFPNGETMLVDSGGRIIYKQDDDAETFEPDVPRIGEMVVSEFLWERGISKIDHVVATHADADHIQGLNDIVRNFGVGNAIFGRIDQTEYEFSELVSQLNGFGISKMVVTAGEVFEIGGVRIEVLNPTENSAMSANNDSIVLKISFGKTSFLFTGDIERESEARLLKSNTDLQSDVVKVAHHGSRSSSTQAFVDAVRPRYAVVSAPRRSIFGHPHREVVERWHFSGAEVLTTGKSGTITIVSDGSELSISTFVVQNGEK